MNALYTLVAWCLMAAFLVLLLGLALGPHWMRRNR